MSSAESGEAECAGDSISESKAERLWFFLWRHSPDGRPSLWHARRRRTIDCRSWVAAAQRENRSKRIFGRSQRQAWADEAQRQRQNEAHVGPVQRRSEPRAEITRRARTAEARSASVIHDGAQEAPLLAATTTSRAATPPTPTRRRTG